MCAYAFFLTSLLASELPHQLHPCHPRPLPIRLLRCLPYILRADPAFGLVEDGFVYGDHNKLSDVPLASLPALGSVCAIDGFQPAVVFGRGAAGKVDRMAIGVQCHVQVVFVVDPVSSVLFKLGYDESGVEGGHGNGR